MTPEKLAQQFHETYERLAPQFGYETRKDSAVDWEKVPEKNRKLMTAVCAEILAALQAALDAARLSEAELCLHVFSDDKWPDGGFDYVEWLNRRIAELRVRASRETKERGDEQRKNSC